MYKLSFLLVCVWLVNPARVFSLAQRIYPGIQVHDSVDCVVIDTLYPEGMFIGLGLQKGDCIYAINGVSIHTAKQFKEVCLPIRVPQSVTLDVSKKKKRLTMDVVAKGRPQNPYKHIDVIYGELYSNECILRTISYLPKRGGTFPAILIIPGYNCSSIENFPRSYCRKLIEQWVKAGFIVYSVEKSGMGDSEGCVACEDVDLQNDIDLFTAAAKQLKADMQVDSNRIYLWGHSMGGIIAPVVAQNTKVKGIITHGTVFRPWHQFLLDMHRIQKPLLEKYSMEETERFIDTIKKVYFDFFVGKKTPEELVQVKAYKHLTETELEYKPGMHGMWGRHWRFWQQIDSLDLNTIWRNLHVPVLVLHGEADYIQCSDKEPKLLADAVNAKDPGMATLVSLPDLDHLLMKSRNYEEAIRHFDERQFLKGNFHQGMANVILNWLERQEE